MLRCFDLSVCRLQIHQDLREDLAKVKTLAGLADVSKQLRLRCQVITNSRCEEARLRRTNSEFDRSRLNAQEVAVRSHIWTV